MIASQRLYALFFYLFSDSGKLVGSDLPLRRLMSSSGHHFLHAFLLHRHQSILGYRYTIHYMCFFHISIISFIHLQRRHLILDIYVKICVVGDIRLIYICGKLVSRFLAKSRKRLRCMIIIIQVLLKYYMYNLSFPFSVSNRPTTEHKMFCRKTRN